MITVRPGSHTYRLLQLLITAGEYPYSSLSIFGSVRSLMNLLYKMGEVQRIKLKSDDTILTTRMFQVSGKDERRTIRLTKSILPVLNDIHPDALGYYLASHPDNNFSGSIKNIWRNHRVSEAFAMCMMAGIESAPYLLPKLQKRSNRKVILEKPSYYVARDIKSITDGEMSKTAFTQITGLMFYPGGAYAVYNTRNSIMKWSGRGEAKARTDLTGVIRVNADVELEFLTSALLFGANEEIAQQTITESSLGGKKGIPFDEIYESIHFIPMNQNGIALLKILTLPDWHEKLMSLLFKAGQRPIGYGHIEYDAQKKDGTYVYSALDGDIARLIRLKETLKNMKHPFDIICFPWQEKFIKGCLNKTVTFKVVDMSVVMKKLGIINPGGG